ncbi:hypothetical protein HK097_011116 [Rhizophlyctis rosea]|uniref:Uracil permease n=1 Tax=Rhizophlyctis rosea TaxID=64517 RepID=A0AAD5SIK6_9FUNG|nr:hypothetical protein HK097_011116 [Rhizophlyctis rosea]
MATTATRRSRSILDKLAVPDSEGYSVKELYLNNHDLKPVELERRTWRFINFLNFWMSDAFNINTWQISSAMIVAGLSWWQAWICVWVGYGLVALFVALNGRAGAVYHIGFPPYVRASFGIIGAYWPVFNRALMACVWYAVQAYLGGQCITLVLRTLAPSFATLTNTMSESSGTNTRDFIGFFLFWTLSLPALWFPVHKIRHLFTAKAIIVPLAGIGYMAWMIVKAKGIGPIISQPATISGTAWSWAMVNGIMSAINNFATLVVNDPDFSRFARKPSDAMWSQIIGIPVSFGFTSLIGILVSSSATVIYGETIWSPLDLLHRVLDEDPYAAGPRAAVFFIALAFSLAQLGVNIAANSISAGSDLTALFPRFINIRRGSYFCAALALLMQPWQLLSSANKFTSYLSAYSLFLSSIAGCMMTDYFIVRRGRLSVPDLYTFDKRGHYWYTAGINWRCIVAYLSGIIINIVGFVGDVSGKPIPIGALRIYQLAFFTGFGLSSIVYYVLCRIWPIPGMETSGWHEDLEYEPDMPRPRDEEMKVSVESGEMEAIGAKSDKDGIAEHKSYFSH